MKATAHHAGGDAGRLMIAVPDLGTYKPHTGIGRVVHGLAEATGLRLTEARYRRSRWPVLRNVPFGLTHLGEAQAVLQPRITGSSALADTSGLPSVAIVHDVGVLDEPVPPGLGSAVGHWSVMQSVRSLRHASRIVAVSQFTKHRLLRHRPELSSKTVVIPNGVDLAYVEYRRSPYEARDPDRSFGRPAAGVPLATQCRLRGSEEADSAPSRGVRSREEGAPRGAASESRRRRKRGLSQSDTGGCAEPRACPLAVMSSSSKAWAMTYWRTHIGAQTSTFPRAEYEGFGLPLLEALAVGTAVVVPDRAAQPEVVAGAGWVTRDDAEALANGVLEAIPAGQDANRRELRRAYAAEYLWPRIARRYEMLLREVLVEGRPWGTP